MNWRTLREHIELDDAVGTLPYMTPEQQRQAEQGAVWMPEGTPTPNTPTRGELPN